MTATFRLEGERISDIASFYDEMNRVFMAGESWVLGESLDALDDLLYGGYGALHGAGPARVVWANSDSARRALGREATIAYYAAKLDRPDVFDVDRARSAITELEAGGGRTYADLVLEVFAGHPEIEFVLA